tara:strand:+ start:2083 stop:2478 length:396 start_codon:yes stop_codon:yes gene_type:complete
MVLDGFYKSLGLAIVVLFSIYIVICSFRVQTKVIETLVSGPNDRSKTPAQIKNYTDEAEDRLLVSKYRKSYEDTIIELEDSINTAILSEVINSAEEVAKDPKSASATITKINGMKAFKDTLNEAMQTLDKK